MSELKKIRVLSSDSNIFSSEDGARYTIPIYQRAYAWGEVESNSHDNEILTLIEDIDSLDDSTSDYYLGTFVVSKVGNNLYEVIDGQQRLTTLYLLLNFFDGFSVNPSLTFECRRKANKTLKDLYTALSQDRKQESSDYDSNLINGMRVIKTALKDFDDKHVEIFKEKLKRVCLYRMEVPDHTDLNRFFEIMNVRGKQLELQDILKARLMSYIGNDERNIKKSAFAELWDICSDMNTYSLKGLKINDDITIDLQWINQHNFDDFVQIVKPNNESPECSISMIMSGVSEVKNAVTVSNQGSFEFESIISFPDFLCQVLRVFIAINGIESCDDNKLIGEQLNRDLLLDEYDNVIKQGIVDSTRFYSPNANIDNRDSFSTLFIWCLLKSRVLFDEFIIKRDFREDHNNGKWSLLLPIIKDDSVEYKETIKPNCNNEETLMLEAALRVSYTSPKAMHWVHQTLEWLMMCDMTQENVNLEFETYVESILKESVIQNFFELCPNEMYEMGVNTHHVVFNYLDYLLWKENKNKYKDNFSFEFRTSVEHWYPQNPSEASFDPWDKSTGSYNCGSVDRFGNLAIIRRDINSKFSNLSPSSKMETYIDEINKGSLKLRLMKDCITPPTTKNQGITSASDNWRKIRCAEHEKEMIQILKNACFDVCNNS